MSKAMNIRVPDDLYAQIERECKANKSAWVIDAVKQKLAKEDDCIASALQRLYMLEKDVAELKKIGSCFKVAVETPSTLTGANAARALEAQQKVKQAVLQYPDANSNTELAKLSKLDRGTIAKYRESALDEIRNEQETR